MRYIVSSAASIVLAYTAICGTLVTVFAIEKFTYVLEVALKYQLSLTDFLVLYASILPDAADFILPVAVLIATYLVLLRKREAREFVALSSAGAGHMHFVAIAMAVGLVAAFMCIGLSGFVKPAANLAFRQQYEKALVSVLSKGIPGGRFYEQGGDILYVASAASGAKHLRAFSFDGPRLERVTVSNCAGLRAVNGKVLSDLCKAQIYLFASRGGSASETDKTLSTGSTTGDKNCRLCESARGRLDVARLTADRSSISFDMQSIFPRQDELRRWERNVFALLRTHERKFGSIDDVRSAGSQIFLALSCMLAVAVAVAAVAGTSFRNRFFVLVGAVGVVMGAIVLARSEILLFGPIGDPAYFSLLITLSALFCTGSVVLTAMLFHQRLVIPSFLRAS